MATKGVQTMIKIAIIIGIFVAIFIIGFIACMMCIFKVGKQADYYNDIYEERKSYTEYDKRK